MLGFVWPETTSSAAGVRDWQFLELFLGAGFEVHYASPAKPNEFSERLSTLGVSATQVQPNDPAFDEFLKKLSPEVVLFDRFMIEEQFGWRVAQTCPEALRVLDTVDLHFLRRAREAAHDLDSQDALREIGSIYRSDLSLVLSSHELRLLHSQFNVPEELLFLSRFLYPEPPASTTPFKERRGFVFMGNHRHAPNADAIRWLNSDLWPRIRALLPDAQVEIFGSYPSRELMRLDDAATGFRVLGHAKDQFETLGRYRVNLVPLRFGAGIKGKVTDGWWTGTPNIATPIGAEGMIDDDRWGGIVASDPQAFAEAAVRLHENEAAWASAAEVGRALLLQYYLASEHGPALLTAIDRAAQDRDSRRRRNFVGRLLQHHHYQSTVYFSKWIEAKSRALPGPA